MLLCLSFDIRRGAFELLEEFSRRERELTQALSDPALADGAVVLSTCNRFEVYLDAPGDPLSGSEPTAEVGSALTSDADAVARNALGRIAASTGQPLALIRSEAEVLSGPQAAEHLFAVASGLKSAAVGEEEIAGQVRRSHQAASSAGTLTHSLERLFQSATRTSRSVKHRTGIRDAGKSLVRLALRLAETRIASWADTPVLMIGTGAYAGATITALRARGVRDISVHSPSGRAFQYAERHGLTPVDPQHLSEALAAAPLVIACTRAADPLLGVEDFTAETQASAAAHPKLLIDLGMPRNIDSAVGGLPNIELLDLETIAIHTEVLELGAAAEAQELVQDAALEFAASQAERDAIPAVLALRQHVLTILEDELCRARRGGAGGDEDPEAALRRLASKLLHTPMTRMRTLGREGRADEAADALAALFGVETAEGSRATSQ